MISEIQLGVHFIVLNFLVNKLPKRKVSQFAKELTECLKLKFKGHWYPKSPDRGTAFRCLEIRDSVFDPVIVQAARVSGISLEEIKAQLPDSFFLWMDPYEVCYRIGDQGSLSVLKRFSPETYQYDQQQAVSSEDIRLPVQSWEKIQEQKRRNLRSVIHHRRSNYSECSSDSDPDSRSRSPDLQDLVNAQPFIPRSVASPIPQAQQPQPPYHMMAHNPQQFIPVSWTTHPVHPELVAVQ